MAVNGRIWPGTIEYAKEQQRGFSSVDVPGLSSSYRRIAWAEGIDTEFRQIFLPSHLIFGGGVVAMVLGGGLIGFAVLRGQPDGSG